MAEKLEFKFDLLTGQSTILDTLNQAQRQAEGFSESLKGIGSNTSFFKLSAAVAVGEAAFELARKAVSSFTNVLTDGVHAAIEKEDAINRLNNSLAQTGKYSASASSDILSFAEEMRKTTRYTDDQIISNAAYLQSLTYLDTQGLKKATESSANLAATLGIDLQSATSLVAKSIEGNTGALSRYGIQVKKGATETENFTNTMQALSQFAGRASSDTNTFGGALAKMNNSLGEVSTSFGQIITQNPIFITAINELSKVFNNLSEFINKNRNNLIEFTNNAIRSFGEGLLRLSPIFNFINESLVSTLSIIRLSIQGWSQLLETMSGLQLITEMVGRFVAGLLEVPKGIVMLIGYMADLAKESTMMQKAFEKAGIKLEDVSKGYSDLEKKIEDLQVSVASVDFDKTTIKALDNMDDLLGKSQDFLKKQTNSVEKIGNRIIEFTDNAIGKQKEVLYNNSQIYVQADTFFDKLAASFSSWDSFVSNFTGPFLKNIKTGLSQFDEAMLVAGPKLLTNITKGAEGARQMAVGFVSMIAEKIPYFGPLIAALFEMFTKGPEFTKAMVKGFIQGIPVIIDNLVASIPAAFEAIIETLPEAWLKILIRLWTGEYAVIFVKGMLKAIGNMPRVLAEQFKNSLKEFLNTFIVKLLVAAAKFVWVIVEGAAEFVWTILKGAGEFIGDIIVGAAEFVWIILKGAGEFVWALIEGAGRFIWELVVGASDFISAVVNGASEIVDAIVSEIGGAFGMDTGGIVGGGGGDWWDPGDWFAKGGLVKPHYAEKGMLTPFIPRGTDTVPSMLTPGEYVVDRSLTKRLTNYLDQQEQGKSSALLSQILVELRKPQTMTSEITINRKTFADLILELNRSNARLA